MANRTIRVLGYGYGSTTCSANVSYNGATVFSGTIPTLNQAEILLLGSEQTVILTFEIDVVAAGTFPLTINFTGGNAAYIEQIFSNYMPVRNPIYSASDWDIITNPSSTSAQKIAVWEPLAVPPLSEADIVVLQEGSGPAAQAVRAAHGLSFIVSSGDKYTSISQPPQAKANVIINGVSEQAGTTPFGEWGWVVPIVSGTGTFTCDLIVAEGLL